MLTLNSVYKSYQNSEESIPVLQNVHIEIQKGEFVAIMGPSGSGKSTLLGIAAGLDRVDSGEVIIDNIHLHKKNEDELSSLRSEKIGFIFQNFQLLKNLTALENVSLPMVIQGKLTEKEILEKSNILLEKVSMSHRKNHFPSQLSGGEEQRVAIARAFANDPVILFADEPTGNLDSKNSEIVLKMLLDLNKNSGSTLVIVTHDPRVANLADWIYEMKDGRLEKRSPVQKKNTEKIPSNQKPLSKKKSGKKK